MKLNPTIAPGRSNRKVRVFAAEIARLCKEGYGCKAIHEALTAAGVSVSKSTVQREVARLAKSPPLAPRRREAGLAVARPGPAVVSVNPSQATTRERLADGGPSSSRDFAAEFMKGRITNPLFRHRS